MKHVEVFTWLMPPPAWAPKGKPYRSRWKMSAAEAAQQGAIEPCPGTMELRREPETQEELAGILTSAWQKRPTPPA